MTTEVVVVTTTNTVVTENTETNVVEVTASGTTPTVEIIAEGPAGPPGGQVMVQDEGVDVAPLEDKLNFVGSMVNVTNNPATETVTVTVTAPSPTISLTGAVTGSGTMTNLGNVSIATTATADPTLTLAGDATGSATFTNLGDATLTVTVVDDSHNHIISNVDGLQDALDSKLPSASYTAADVLTKIKTVDGSGSGLDADLLDGESGAYYIDFTNATNKPDPTITLSGDATGSVTLTDLASGTLSVTVVDDSHNHIISNVDGLQDALDAKLASADYTAADVLTKIKTVDGAGSGLDADLLDGQSSAYYTAINDRLGYTAENAANKGIAGGYASLDGAGLVPSTQLPSYVDDVLEYANVAAFPATGVSGVIYVAIDTSKTYRWSGSTYVEISASPGTTDALTEGTVNLYFTTARARQSVSAGTGISYNNSTGVITNSAPDQTVALTAGTGISTSGTYPNFTITNSAPDQTVALTAGTGISTSGTYPNFTITNAAPDQTVVLTAGTGISTSGTYPNFTITNSAPDQTVALTGAGTTSISGTYPNFTISSADQYVGTVTSVAVSGGTTGLTVTGSPITSSGTITLGGTLVVANGGTGATTASGARLNLGAAASGANTDITSLGGITGGISSPDFIQFDTTATVTPATGRLYFNDGEGGLSYTLKGGNVVQEVGQSQQVLVYNGTGATLNKGQVVYSNGAQGQRITVALALATSDATSARTLGVVAESIANGAEGWVSTLGIVENIDTSAFTEGVQLYLSGTTAGALTATKPYAPTHMVYVARCIKSNASSGRLFVTVQNGYELDELHNVSAQSPTNGQTIVYNSTSGLWEKNTVSLTAGVNGTLPVANGGTGVTSSTGTGSVVLSNSPTLVTPVLGAASATSITNALGSAASPSYTFVGETDTGVFSPGANIVSISTGGNEQFRVANTASAVNYVQVTGSATGSDPTISAQGSDTDRNLKLTSKGTGAVQSTTRFEAQTGAANYWRLSGAATTATPVLSVLGSDTNINMGLTTKGTGSLVVTTNGSERFRVDGSGNVGIGTTSPAQRIHAATTAAPSGTTQSFLRLTGDATYGADFGGGLIQGTGPIATISTVSAGTATERMRIDTSGNVGIGTTSPSFKLDVQGNSSSTATVARVYNGDTSASSNAVFNCSTGQGVNAEWYSYSSANWFGTKSNHPQLFITNNTERMRITSDGKVGIGTSSPSEALSVPSGNVYASAFVVSGNAHLLYAASSTDFGFRVGTSGPYYSIGTTGSDNMRINSSSGGDMLFAIGSTERMRINSSGNIGIGTSSPQSKMEIRATSGGSVFNALTLSNYVGASVNTGVALYFDPNGAGTLARAASIQSVQATSGNYADLRLFTANSDTPAERMRITPAGNVGIGTTSPTTKLTISQSAGSVPGGQLLVKDPSYSGVALVQGATGEGYLWNIANSYLSIGTNSTERMRITAAGNVGIGTSSPGYKLDVTGQTLIGNGIAQAAPSTTDIASTSHVIVSGQGGNALFFGQYPGAQGYAQWIQSSFLNPTTATYNLILQPLGGNVGIGTNAPASLLHVKRGSNATEVYPTGTWASRIINATDSSGENGLLVGNRWAANTSTVFEAGSIYGGASGSWWSFYKIDGAGQSFWSNGGTERMRLESNGKLLIRTSASTAASIVGYLQANSDIFSSGSNAGIFWENRSSAATSNTNWYGWYTTSGTIYLYNGSANVASINPANGVYTALSDASKKKDFEPSDVGLDAVLGLKPTLYRMAADEADAPKQLGFIAQEVKDYIPQAYVEEQNVDATGNETTYIGLNDRPIIAALVKAVQELTARVAELEGK